MTSIDLEHGHPPERMPLAMLVGQRIGAGEEGDFVIEAKLLEHPDDAVRAARRAVEDA
jgi:hypothetical protein